MTKNKASFSFMCRIFSNFAFKINTIKYKII